VKWLKVGGQYRKEEFIESVFFVDEHTASVRLYGRADYITARPEELAAIREYVTGAMA
jgi:hypothetical protein